jgi:dTDP-glucose 4,6-dehydratase
MNRILKNKTILVIGGCGFMGSNFIHHLFNEVPGVRVINADALTYAGMKENLAGVPKSRYTFVRADLCDTKKIAALMKRADYVVNFAAETHVDRSIHGGADAFVRTNISGVHSILKALQMTPSVKLLIHISTDEVWGDLPLGSDARFTEESPMRPNSPYAASKAAGDLLIRSYVETYKLPVIVTHATNNFGPRQFPEKLIPFFTMRALEDKPLPLYGDGLNERDWIFVDDHSSAVRTILVKGAAGEVYVIGQEGKARSNKSVARDILTLVDKSTSLITYVKDRPAHDRRYAVRAKKLRALGWKPRHTFAEALKTTIRWYRDNPAWLRAARAKAKLNAHLKA